MCVGRDRTLKHQNNIPSILTAILCHTDYKIRLGDKVFEMKVEYDKFRLYGHADLYPFPVRGKTWTQNTSLKQKSWFQFLLSQNWLIKTKKGWLIQKGQHSGKLMSK